MAKAIDENILNSEVVGRHAKIITRGRVVGGGSIWYRARIIKETANLLIVSFFGKPDNKRDDNQPGKPVLKTESIKKIDIVHLQLMGD